MTPILVTTVVFAETLVKITLLMAAASGIAAYLRRRGSAASRHLVWTLAAASLLLFPILSTVAPVLNMAIPVTVPIASPAALAASDVASRDDATPTMAVRESAARAAAAIATDRNITTSTSATLWQRLIATAPAMFLAVVMLLIARLALERWRAHRVVRRAVAIDDHDWLRLARECADSVGARGRFVILISREQTMPMAVGVWRPAVVMPAVAESWPEDRRRAVMLHELAHVARHDCFTQLLAELACALYWPHPGVWWMARRQRVERELACDDRVLAAGTSPRDYASHLLEVAYAVGGGRAPALAVAMARRRQLEGRLLAVLDAARNRTTPARRSRVAAIAGAAAIVGVLAAASATLAPAQPAGGHASSAEPALDGTASRIAEQGLAGTWDLRLSADGRIVRLRLNESDTSSYGLANTIDHAEAEKLRRALLPALQPGGAGNGQFRVERDAGTLVFDGTFRAGVGAGTYTFEPNRAFPVELAKRSFARPTVTDQYLFTRTNIGSAFIDELAAQRYARPDLSQLVDAARHGVSLDYLRQMGQLGYRVGGLDALVRLKDHGVTPEFARALRAQRLAPLSVDELVSARQRGISPEYVSELRALGYTDLSLATLADARQHGISPEYVRALQQLGYRLAHADLVRAREHGVGPEYIGEMAGAGFEHLTLDDLIRLRQAGVDASYVREVRTIGYTDLTVDRVIAFRQQGVTTTNPAPKLKQVPWARFHALIRQWLK